MNDQTQHLPRLSTVSLTWIGLEGPVAAAHHGYNLWPVAWRPVAGQWVLLVEPDERCGGCSVLVHQAVAITACSALIDRCRCWRI
jgi:hypothetical protein